MPPVEMLSYADWRYNLISGYCIKIVAKCNRPGKKVYAYYVKHSATKLNVLYHGLHEFADMRKQLCSYNTFDVQIEQLIAKFLCWQFLVESCRSVNCCTTAYIYIYKYKSLRVSENSLFYNPCKTDQQIWLHLFHYDILCEISRCSKGV